MPRAFLTGGSGFIGQHLVSTLKARGHEVRALARREPAERLLRQLGAEVVPGDLADGLLHLEEALAGCDVVFHLAAEKDPTRGREYLFRVNDKGTGLLLAQARGAGVRRFVHISPTDVFSGVRQLIRADETWPRPPQPVGLYPLSKAVAEDRALAANAPPDFETVVVRPAFVWGPGDRTYLPVLAKLVRRDKFAWIDEGHYPFSTCHVRNAAEGLLLAAERGRGGETYFLTDGPPVDLRRFITALLATQGLDPGQRSLPEDFVRATNALLKLPWRFLPEKHESPPDYMRLAMELMAREHTVVDDKARREFGYGSPVTLEQGLAELRELAGLSPLPAVELSPVPRPLSVEPELPLPMVEDSPGPEEPPLPTTQPIGATGSAPTPNSPRAPPRTSTEDE